MKVVLSMDGDRITPVFEATRFFLLVTTCSDGVLIHREVLIAQEVPVAKAKSMIELGGRILISSSISWPLEAILTSSGMRVISNTCGPLDEVIAGFFYRWPDRTGLPDAGMSRPAAQASPLPWKKMVNGVVMKRQFKKKGVGSCREEIEQVQSDLAR